MSVESSVPANLEKGDATKVHTGSKIFIMTGDPSADLHAAHVAEALRHQNPSIQLEGIGGPHLEKVGVPLFETHEQMSRVGLDAWLSIPYHVGLGKRVLDYLETWQPNAVLMIDYGGFHLHMAGYLKKRGIRVFYYIPPQVWASRRERIGRIQQSVDHVFCIFPFEEALYKDHGVAVTYVGHPLTSHLPPPVDRNEFCKKHGLDPARKILAVLPGSRRAEVRHLAKPLIHAIQRIQTADPSVQCVVAQAASLKDQWFHQKMAGDLPASVIVLKDETRPILSVADAAVVASGTATLETAMYGTPMVIVYKLQPFVLEFGLKFCYLPCIGLPNILIDPHHPVAPELLHRHATPENISRKALTMLDPSAPETKKAKAAFAELHKVLDAYPTAEKVAGGILALLASSGDQALSEV
ncbi:MAG: lipid-A-disaccharide synthase [Vampirovibrio sp.]|nr:lipid-A-disaccharide synthase [Vampirovibrio sp.]